MSIKTCPIKLPTHRGEEVTFEAHGRRFHLKKVGRTAYMLSCPLHSPRTRFGNAPMIRQDVEQALQTGTLPGKEGRP